VLLSALLVYGSVLGAVPAVAILAVANTAEGLFGAYLMNRFAGGRHALQTPRHALRFAGLTALTSVCCSSMVATLTLVLLGHAPLELATDIWMNWSLGVFSGTVLSAPLVLLFAQGRTDRWKRAQVLEAATVLVSVLAVGLVVFCGVPLELRGYPLEMACFVVLLWPAFRLGRRAASLGLLVLMALAMFGTLSGYGPFVSATPTASLMMVVCYMSLMSVLIQRSPRSPLNTPCRIPAPRPRRHRSHDGPAELSPVGGSSHGRDHACEQNGHDVCRGVLRHGRAKADQRRARPSHRQPRGLQVRGYAEGVRA
jgi:integral membrane sensor domain MASE1